MAPAKARTHGRGGCSIPAFRPLSPTYPVFIASPLTFRPRQLYYLS